jgi:putative DNA primase/helicase
VLETLGWPKAGYLEFSPSGSGLHLIGRGVLRPGSPRKQHGTELLDVGIVTLTGQALPGGGDLTFPDGVLAALQHSWARPTVRASAGPPRHHVAPRRTDTQLLNRARNSRSGPKFRRLHDFGDTQSDYPSRSEGVAALIAMLLYWCDSDLARAERLYRQSSLYRPDLDDRPAGPDGRTRLRLTLDRVASWRRRS